MLQDYEFCSNFVTKFKNEEKKMKKILFGIMTLALMASCTESMEDRAVREAREYTEKVCPTLTSTTAVPTALCLTKTHALIFIISACATRLTMPRR